MERNELSQRDPGETTSQGLKAEGLGLTARLYRTPIAGEAFMAIANESGFKRTLSELPAE